MPIRNYTSIVKSSKSMGDIQALLAEHGASRIMMEYENREPVSLSFVMDINKEPVQFRLTVDPDALLAAMKADRKVPNSSCIIDQAKKTAWKNKYEWLHIQMAEIETGQARVEQLLLGYAVDVSGKTIFERVEEQGMRFLAS